MDPYSVDADQDPAGFLNADLDSAAFCKNNLMKRIRNTNSKALKYTVISFYKVVEQLEKYCTIQLSSFSYKYLGEIDGFIEQNSCFCLLTKLHAIVAD